VKVPDEIEADELGNARLYRIAGSGFEEIPLSREPSDRRSRRELEQLAEENRRAAEHWHALAKRSPLKTALLVSAGVVGGALLGAGALWTLQHVGGRGLVEGPRGSSETRGAAPGAPLEPAALVWTGPVSREQIQGADVPGLPLVVKGCTGDGKPSCGEIAESWKGADGRRMPSLRRALKLPAQGGVILAGFSAGGHLIWRVLQDAADRKDADCVYLADGTYTTSWVDKGKRLAAPIPSYVAYGRDVLADPRRLFLATASSSPNKDHPTGAETLRAIAAALELPRGELSEIGLVEQGALEQLLATARRGSRRAEQAGADAHATPEVWRSGSVILADFGAALSHEEHATVLSKILFPALVAPHFAKSGRPA